MALIIIDGYNITGLLHTDIEAERERLISALSGYGKLKGHEITVVFDGWKNGPGSEQRQVTGGVEVVYSALGEKADSVIKRVITGGRQWIVVTSDRDIQRHAWASGSVPIGAEEFMRVLERGAWADEHAAEEDEDDETEGRRRQAGGNPRKASKRQKALERAFRKL